MRLLGLSGYWGRLNGLEAEGYEIHHGQGLPLFHQEGPLLATWLHGLLENPGVQKALLGREARGLEEALDLLADAWKPTWTSRLSTGPGAYGEVLPPR